MCPEGFARDAATGACLDVIPPDDCAPGTGAFLGSTTCQPIGWTALEPAEMASSLSAQPLPSVLWLDE